MESVPTRLKQQLTRYGQEHVLRWWPEISAEERARLIRQLEAIDLDELQSLYDQRERKDALPPLERIEPLPHPHIEAADAQRYAERGARAFRGGEVAFLVVAGGQGSRLGFDQPKGMFPIGPVSGKSLFQWHAEKILALRRRYQANLPYLVMTSPATDAETRRYFDDHAYFGLPADEVFFFCQGTMPALDLATGKLLMEAKGSLFLSPNGHGGTLTGLADSGLLGMLEKRGIRTISYFQVDNPLTDLAGTVFLGRHLEEHAEASSKVLVKQTPADKLGNFVLVAGRCTIIEYSDLPLELAEKQDANGQLLFWAGSPAIHLFDIGFLRRMTQGTVHMPWHLARKKVPYLDEQGRLVEPTLENALKFERFIFDVLPRAERWTVMATSRKEFEPLKNATGPDSPATVRQALSDQAADWLEEAGVQVPRTGDGHVGLTLEISPLYALDAAELTEKLDRRITVSDRLYLH